MVEEFDLSLDLQDFPGQPELGQGGGGGRRKEAGDHGIIIIIIIIITIIISQANLSLGKDRQVARRMQGRSSQGTMADCCLLAQTTAASAFSGRAGIFGE